MLDPFSPDKGKNAPAKKSWEEALQKPKAGGIGSHRNAESEASKKLAEEFEADSKKSEKVEDPPPPPKPEVVLNNPQWRLLRPSPAPIQAGDPLYIPKAIAPKVSILKIA